MTGRGPHIIRDASHAPVGQVDHLMLPQIGMDRPTVEEQDWFARPHSLQYKNAPSPVSMNGPRAAFTLAPAEPAPATNEALANRTSLRLMMFPFARGDRPLLLVTGEGRLNLFSTATIFGTPVKITLSELAIESFFPADNATAAVFYTESARR